MARIEKGQSYPELGFSVDGRGIATDLNTGQTLAKGDVDSRLSGSDYSQLAKKRGGVAGTWDRNKKPITTGAGITAGLLATVLSGGALGPVALAALTAGAGAGTNAAIKGLDREGKSGVGFDAKQAAKGLIPGAVQGYTGGKIGGALGAGGSDMPTTGDFGNVANAGVHNTFDPTSMLPAVAASGGSFIDKAKGLIPKAAGALGGGGLPGFGKVGDMLTGNGGMNALAAAQGLNAANLGRQSTEYAKNAMKTQDELWAQRAPLRTQGIAGMQAAPVKLPELAALGGTANPFAQKRAV